MSDAEWEHEIAVLRACRHTHVVQFQVRGVAWAAKLHVLRRLPRLLCCIS